MYPPATFALPLAHRLALGQLALALLSMWSRPFRRGERVLAHFQGQGPWFGAIVTGCYQCGTTRTHAKPILAPLSSVHRDTATYDLR